MVMEVWVWGQYKARKQWKCIHLQTPFGNILLKVSLLLYIFFPKVVAPYKIGAKGTVNILINVQYNHLFEAS